METHGQHEIDLWLCAACREVRHIEAGDGPKEIPDNALGNAPCQLGEMGCLHETIRGEWHNLLQPGST